MAGFFSDRSRKKRGAAVDNLNLVPFIDLFSTLVIFLVATAVWEKLAAINLSMGVEDRASVHVPQDLSRVKKIQSDVKIILQKDSIDLFINGKLSRHTLKEIPDSSNDPKMAKKDFGMVKDFALEARQKYPEKKDVVVMVSDSAVYQDLIAVLDICLEKKFDELVISGLEEGGL